MIAAVIASTLSGAPGTVATTPSTPGPIPLGNTFTVTLGISGYSDPTEIDGYNFRVSYNSALFSLVGGSLGINDASGAGENWLRLVPQDGVGAGALPLSDFTVTSAGVVDVSVSDLRLTSTRGTTAGAGFLYSFDLMAIGLGTGTILPSAGAGGTVLFDTALSPAGVPGFSGITLTVVPEPSALALIAAGTLGGCVFRIRRKATHENSTS